MATKQVNRICRIGSGFAVFLPIGWIRYNKLKPGDKVVVTADDNIEITIIKDGMRNGN